MFNPIIAEQPNLVLSYLSNYLKATLTDDEVNIQTVNESFVSYYNELESSQSSYTEFAAAVGIKGSYGFYSGSVKASVDSKTYEASTNFNSSYNATINCGTVTFYKPADIAAIRACLQTELCIALDGISSLSDAKMFTGTYGTHLVLGLNLGGCIQLKSEAQTNSYQSQLEMSQSVSAAYSGAISISAVATAAENLVNNSALSTLQKSIYTSGGDSNMAAAIDLTNSDTLIAWADTCTDNTSYGITEAIEIWKLTTGNAQKILKEYIHLVILAQSINYPTIFTAKTPLMGGTLVNTQAVANDANFRIIGGGAYLESNVSSFLVSSYPQTNNVSSNINSWSVSSHDIATLASSSNYLTAYAIAIYDPSYGIDEGLLGVQMTTAQGTNSGPGMDQATASIDTDYLIAGGGIQASITGGYLKFIMASYPSGNNSWSATHSDYEQAASGVTLTVYAIGIKSNNTALVLTSSGIISTGTNSNHGNQTTSLGEGYFILGGGVSVTDTQGGFGNLVQQSFPSSANSWTEYNKDDLGEPTSANCTAYAFGLTATLNID
ncbi:MAC/perforin domain-containing protein [Mucilaginibacter rigui]|uniref:MAC/perforin domain-containing protein n=1 Tax=Mucilaginibacter rigui TaxID=534635 RepID=UPI00174795E4|nr:MAC/perforin domain-containing protein [Mucilaginibacter rigui]